ncbi:MAG: DUF3037 domain-containing protein [Gemmatimonadales bacterium]|nr:MAG: DUF3037 domain-containing protein [Gemmatimonadales bacterium]
MSTGGLPPAAGGLPLPGFGGSLSSSVEANQPTPDPSPLVEYDWAVLRVVPRVHLGASVNVGVVLHARTADFLAMRAVTDVRLLREAVPLLDAGLLARYLEACLAVCRGEAEPEAGHAAVALAPTSERFHWLTAPRSDVLQCSPIHGGLTHDPLSTLERLYLEQVTLT